MKTRANLVAFYPSFLLSSLRRARDSSTFISEASFTETSSRITSSSILLER